MRPKSGRGAFERALVDALRTAGERAIRPGPPGPIEARVFPWLDPQTAEGVALDLLAVVEEIDLAQPARVQPAGLPWRRPGEPALAPAEFAFLAALAALQTSDVCSAIAALSRMMQDGRTGRVLLPMKFLAVRLDMAGIEVSPIGARRFTVIAGGRAGSAARTAAPLTVAS